MKSVCILLQNHYETDVRVRRKAEALVAAGYDVDVLTLHSKYSKGQQYQLGGVNIFTISLGKKRGSLFRYAYEYVMFFLWALFKVSRRYRTKQYAVVDVNNLPDFLVFAGVYAKWRGAKIVLDMHEVTPEFYISKYGVKPESWLIAILRYLERVSLRFADYVININRPIEELLVQRGMPASKSTIVMNSVDEAFFNQALLSPVTADAGTSSPAFVMMYHGTVTHIYGLDIAIRAFGLVHHEMPGAELWVLGKGSDLTSVQQLANELGLESKVRFVGLVLPQEIPHWLQRCDIGVLATRQDVFLDLSFSAKLSEYIIMGKAVIASRLATIGQYFSEKALAFFEPHDETDLARQMVSLYLDSDRRSRLAEQAMREYAPLRWEVMKQRYLELMARAAGCAPNRSEMYGSEGTLSELVQPR